MAGPVLQFPRDPQHFHSNCLIEVKACRFQLLQQGANLENESTFFGQQQHTQQTHHGNTRLLRNSATGLLIDQQPVGAQLLRERNGLCFPDVKLVGRLIDQLSTAGSPHLNKSRKFGVLHAQFSFNRWRNDYLTEQPLEQRRLVNLHEIADWRCVADNNHDLDNSRTAMTSVLRSSRS